MLNSSTKMQPEDPATSGEGHEALFANDQGKLPLEARRALVQLLLGPAIEEVAFTRQVVSDDLDVPVLLRRAPLTFLDSVLLLFLRQRLTQSDAHDERGVVALQEMVDHLAVFEPQGNLDRAKFERQVENAIEKTKKHSLLQRIRGSEDRFEIAPTLKLLLPAEEVQALAGIYARLAATATNDDCSDPEESAFAADEKGDS
jgi:Domain of unknown function (DUF4194)